MRRLVETAWRGFCGVMIAMPGLAMAQQPKPQSAMFPFVIPWDDATPGITSVADWLEKPAGKDGFVTVKGSHLYVGDKRIRFLGTNLCFGANFPKHEDADAIAARMAKFGMNCVRFHHMDHNAAPSGIWAKDMRTIDPQQLDRLCYLIAALKKQGIYTNINLHVSREYPDMPRWPGMPGYFKGVDQFYPPMIEAQKQFARDLLGHVNPYTQLRLADDPAVAFVEINNENGLIHAWHSGDLDDMIDPYKAELTKLWNAWLAKKYGNDDALRTAWTAGAVSGGPEMLTNGSFEQGVGNWFLEVHGGAVAAGTIETVDGRRAYKVAIDKTSPTSWHVQLTHPGVSVQQGRNYVVSMRARASSSRKVTLAISQAGEPWQGLGSREVKLTTEWQTVTARIISDGTEPKARLQITGLGSEAGEVWISDVSIKQQAVHGLVEGESLQKQNIAILQRKAGTPRTRAAQRDFVEFLWQSEADYWTSMAAFLKDELGVKAPLIGTAVGFSPPTMQSKLDVVDIHGYWQHPHFPNQAWNPVDWIVPNRSLAGDREGGTLTWMAMRRVAGKPYVCTEFNASAPNTFSSEAFLLAGAYAALQDWDALFAFAYSHSYDAWQINRMRGFFDIDHHSTKLVTFPATAALFFRGDVTPAQREVAVHVTPDQSVAYSQQSGSWWGSENGGASKRFALQHRLSIRESDAAGQPPIPPAPEAGARVVSDTNELVWDTPRQLVTIDTPRSKALIGRLTDGPVTLGDVTIHAHPNQQNWAAITLTAMQGESITAGGARVLVTATGNIENTGMKWKDESKTSVGRDWGQAPVLVEGIPATITLKVPAARLKAYRLDERGQRAGELPIEQPDADHAAIRIGPESKTLWYELVVQ